jgi:hypothetical protein
VTANLRRHPFLRYDPPFAPKLTQAAVVSILVGVGRSALHTIV